MQDIWIKHKERQDGLLTSGPIKTPMGASKTGFHGTRHCTIGQFFME
jgi:hypothetical protein